MQEPSQLKAEQLGSDCQNSEQVELQLAAAGQNNQTTGQGR